MKVISAKDYQEMSRIVAHLIAAQVILKPDCVLGLATGSSPIGAYRQLVEWYKRGDLDFSRVRTVNLDEYVGLPAEHNQSFAWFMRRNLFDHVNIDLANVHIPRGIESDAAAECARYDAIIRSLGGVDLQLLGLGMNGHIGFIEPNDHFIRHTHRARLSDATIQANKRFFPSESDVPRFAYTMGCAAIMRARRIVMVVSGASKAEIVKQAFCGEITPQTPASILQLHRDFTLVADQDALSLINGAKADDFKPQNG